MDNSIRGLCDVQDGGFAAPKHWGFARPWPRPTGVVPQPNFFIHKDRQPLTLQVVDNLWMDFLVWRKDAKNGHAKPRRAVVNPA